MMKLAGIVLFTILYHVSHGQRPQATMEVIRDFNLNGGLSDYIKTVSFQGSIFLLDRGANARHDLYRFDDLQEWSTNTTWNLVSSHSSDSNDTPTLFVCGDDLVISSSVARTYSKYSTNFTIQSLQEDEVIVCISDQLVRFTRYDSSNQECIRIALPNGTMIDSTACISSTNPWNLQVFASEMGAYLIVDGQDNASSLFVWDLATKEVVELGQIEAVTDVKTINASIVFLGENSISIFNEISWNFTTASILGNQFAEILGFWNETLYILGNQVYSYDLKTENLTLIQSALSGRAASGGFYTWSQNTVYYFDFFNLNVTSFEISANLNSLIGEQVSVTDDGLYLITGNDVHFISIFNLNSTRSTFPANVTLMDILFKLKNALYLTARDASCQIRLFRLTDENFTLYPVQQNSKYWLDSISTSTSTFNWFRYKAFFFVEYSCGKPGLWNTDGYCTCKIMDVDFTFPPKRCPSNPSDSYMYYSMAPGFVRTNGNPIVAGYGGGENITNPTDSNSPIECGTYINGSYHFVNGGRLYFLNETWDDQTYELHVNSEIILEIPENAKNSILIGDGQKAYFYRKSPGYLAYMDAVTPYRELSVPNVNADWSDVLLSNGSFYIVVPVDGKNTVYTYDSQLQLEKLAILSDSTSSQARLYNVSNVLWAYSFPKIFVSENGRNFLEFSTSENFETPFGYYNGTLYHGPLFHGISWNSNSSWLIGNYTNPQMYEKSVWMFDSVNGQRVWSTQDLDTGHVKHFNETYGDTTPVLIGNGAAVAPVRTEVTGLEPGILPGPYLTEDEDDGDTTWDDTTTEATTSTLDDVRENGANVLTIACFVIVILALEI